VVRSARNTKSYHFTGKNGDRTPAVGRRNWTFAGSDEGGRRAATVYTLIATANLNEIDPQAWLADELARLPDHPAKRIHELLP
jgi:transposase